MNKFFSSSAAWISRECGKSYVFALAVLSVLLWLAIGPYFHYSDTYNLVYNTILSIISFLMLFLLQNSQTRESTAMQIKLDELIRVSHQARNLLIDVENTSDAEIANIKQTIKDKI